MRELMEDILSKLEDRRGEPRATWVKRVSMARGRIDRFLADISKGRVSREEQDEDEVPQPRWPITIRNEGDEENGSRPDDTRSR